VLKALWVHADVEMWVMSEVPSPHPHPPIHVRIAPGAWAKIFVISGN